jgi:adenylate kinase family enzyme
MINIVLFGKPGKGTQADFKRKYNLTHLSTGDIFDLTLKTIPLGRLTKTYMDKGDLVPDGSYHSNIESEVDKTRNLQILLTVSHH